MSAVVFHPWMEFLQKRVYVPSLHLNPECRFAAMKNCLKVLQTKWYMCHFGHKSVKPHLGFSNTRSLLNGIAARAGYLSNSDRENFTKIRLAKHAESKSRHAKTFTGVRKNLKASQIPDCM